MISMRTIVPAILGGALCIWTGSPSIASQDDALISLDVRNLDIYDTVRLLATQANANVVVDTSVEHQNVTLRLERVRFEEALSTLARASGLEAVRVGNVTYLGTGDVMNRRYPANSSDGNEVRIIALKNANPDDVAHSLTDALPKGTVLLGDRRTSSIVVGGSRLAVERALELTRALDVGTSLTNVSIPMRFAKASAVVQALKATLSIAPPSAVYANDAQNSIILTGTGDFLSQAGSIVTKLDRPDAQVRYEVRVTDVTPVSDTGNVGLLFGGVDVTGTQQAGTGSTVTTFTNKTLAINATLNALVTKGDASILARPSLSTLNNVQASLLVGQSYPIVYFDPRTGTQQVQFVNVGVNLTVTPTVGSDGEITTELETDYSQFLSFVNSFPVIGTRKVQSTFRIRDGDTIVIAGLFSDVNNATVSRVPFLSDIPILGEVFKNRQWSHTRDEVVFFITPHLVDDASKNAR